MKWVWGKLLSVMNFATSELYVGHRFAFVLYNMFLKNTQEKYSFGKFAGIPHLSSTSD